MHDEYTPDAAEVSPDTEESLALPTAADAAQDIPAEMSEPAPEETAPTDTSVTLPASDEATGDNGSTVASAAEEASPAAEEVSAATPADSNADPEDAPALRSDRELLESLQRELAELRAALSGREAAAAREADRREFRELYPEVSIAELPDAVWEDVERGIPLSAAYARCERRRIRLLEQAEKSNGENLRRSPGMPKAAPREYFTPDEVRAMSPLEVRENYQKIMFSMQKWH